MVDLVTTRVVAPARCCCAFGLVACKFLSRVWLSSKCFWPELGRHGVSLQRFCCNNSSDQFCISVLYACVLHVVVGAHVVVRSSLEIGRR